MSLGVQMSKGLQMIKLIMSQNGQWSTEKARDYVPAVMVQK